MTSNQRSLLFAALRQVVVVWAAELLLARISGEPQAWDDVLESLGILLTIGVPGVWLAGFVSEPRLRTTLAALASLPPLLLVTLGILLPLFIRSGAASALLFVACVAGALATWRLVRGARSEEPIAGPLGVCIVVGLTAATVWLVYTAPPPVSIWLPFALGLGLLTLLASVRTALPAIGIAAFTLAVWPESELQPNWQADGPPPQGPDIVLIVVDTLRADSARGMESYRRIAADGVEFRAAQAAAPWTTPSMGSLLTGLSVPEHGARRSSEKGLRRKKLRPEVETLAERLAAAGYDTAGLVTHGSAGSLGGFDRGFALWREEREEWALPRARSERKARPFAARLLTQLGLQGRPPSIDGQALTNRALSVLDARRPERPLFLWLQYFDDHLPYRHMENAPLDRDHQIALDNGEATRFSAEAFWRTPEGTQVMRAGYEFEVDFIDRQIGRLLDALGPVPERGRIVILTSDHGEEFWEHGGILHGHTLYQELLHVPLVIAGLPERAAGTREAGVVGHIDVTPTVLAAAGLPLDGTSGRDLAPALEPRSYLSENVSSYPSERLVAVREGRFKLIFDRESGESRLFDLERDPGETQPIGENHPEVVTRLSALAVVATPGGGLEIEEVEAELSPEDLEMLEALGYVE